MGLGNFPAQGTSALPVAKVREFEDGLLGLVRGKHIEILNGIRDTRDLSDDLGAKLKAVAPDVEPIRTLRGTGYALNEDLPPQPVYDQKKYVTAADPPQAV